jgi:hypothetical protein
MFLCTGIWKSYYILVLKGYITCVKTVTFQTQKRIKARNDKIFGFCGSLRSLYLRRDYISSNSHTNEKQSQQHSTLPEYIQTN